MSSRERGHIVTILWLAFALGAGSVPEASADVADYLGRSVGQVRLDVEGVELHELSVLALVETRVGQPLSMVQVRETIGHLFGLGRYEDVQVRASLMGNEVALVYDLVPLHHVRALEFRGRLELDESLLRATITERLGSTPPVGRAADAARALVDLYRDQGYRRATVTPSSRREHNPDRTTLVFDITPGVRTRIGKVTVEGPQRDQAKVLSQIDVRMGEPFRPADLATSLGRYRANLQAQDYYEARANYLPRYSEDESTVDVTVIVNTGPLVKVRFEGHVLSEDEREALVPIARERSVDEDLLEDSKRRIENRLKDEGYRDARADYRREETDGVLTVVFVVTRGPQYRLARVEISGNNAVPEAPLRGLVRLKEKEPFVDSILAADVAGVEEQYRRLGFASVKIASTVSPTDGTDGGERSVAARITVAEGVRSVIGNVTFEGNRAVDDATLHRVARLVAGEPFYEPQTMVATDDLALEYLNRGYQNAIVKGTLNPSADGRTVDVAFNITEGVQIIVDHILIVGNSRTKSEVIERELVLKPGEPLGQNASIESRQRLLALGLFRRVQIADLRHPGEEGRRDVLVTVEESRATTLGVGGGVEVRQRLRRSAAGAGPAEERIEFAPRGFFEIGRRNLWGKNRSINLFTRVSFRPKGESPVLAATPNDPSDGRYGFNEYRVSLNYREPRIFGSRADGLLSGSLEQGIRSSFNFIRRATSLEIARRLTPVTSVSGRYSLERTELVNEQYKLSEQPLIDRLFPQVRLSSLSSSLIRSTRDDAIEPTRGTLTTVDAAAAARAFGSEVGFIKTLVKGFFYRQLTGARRVVFAGGGTLGLADGFPREVTVTNGDVRRTETVRDLPARERFYAGGDTTVRGFALDRLGTPETIDADGFPKGGQALVIFNAELRVPTGIRMPVCGELGTVGFIDVGNVFARVAAIDLGELRGGAGFGVRCRSPVGPIRVDLGFKLSRPDLPDREEKPWALHISIGQAF